MAIPKAIINIQNMKKDDLSLNIRHNLGTLYFHKQIDICIFLAFVATCKLGAISAFEEDESRRAGVSSEVFEQARIVSGRPRSYKTVMK